MNPLLNMILGSLFPGIGGMMNNPMGGMGNMGGNPLMSMLMGNRNMGMNNTPMRNNRMMNNNQNIPQRKR